MPATELTDEKGFGIWWIASFKEQSNMKKKIVFVFF